MSKTLTFEIPDEIYAYLQALAVRTGRGLEETALEWLAQTAPISPPPLTGAERRAAMERLLRHAGAVNSSEPQSGGNEQIDDVLAAEYGSTHEE